jgi:DNA-binding transcriptional LysR family regulator
MIPGATLNDLQAFAAVAQARSFTRAAARLGISPSALSQTIRGLEARLGLRLLARTTRSVAPTEAGERLLRTLGPAFEEIAATLAALGELRDRPSGTIRITTAAHAAETILWPALEALLPAHPAVTVEVHVDDALTDLVAGRYDAGIRLGELVDRDMVAVRIGPPLRLAVVGSPAYFAAHPPPRLPQDLAAHACVNIRLPTLGALYAWEFEKDGRPLRVQVAGPLVVNSGAPLRRAALAGLGLVCTFEDVVAADVAAGRLVRVLEDWSPPFPGYHLYYPSRRQLTPAFSLLVEALRWRG